MPTPLPKARKLISKGKAEIYKYDPFTIKLTGDSKKHTQKVESGMDTGYLYIGYSLKSDKHEYVHAEYVNLEDEKLKHKASSKYRRTRRNHLRYREPRFNNRVSTKKEGWIAPSLQHKIDNHVNIFNKYAEVCSIENSYIEVGQFDTALMESLNSTGQVLSGADYQKGLRYGFSNTREAVLVRDNYTCQICGKSIKDGVVLHTHHIIPQSEGGSDKPSNLLTVCHKCHTSKEHKKGGVLFKLEPVSKPLKEATYMNIIRWRIINKIKDDNPDVNIHTTYGSFTKANRRKLGKLPKTHANDAYAMGEIHPLHRSKQATYKKRRRNDRILSTFYDAKYIDSRDGSTKTGSQLSCGRTNRREKRNSDKNERVYRLKKVKAGRCSIRRQRYFYQNGSIVEHRGKRATVSGISNYGRYILINKQRVKPDEVRFIKYASGWLRK